METTIPKETRNKRPRWLIPLIVLVAVLAVGGFFAYRMQQGAAAMRAGAGTGEVVEAFIGDLAASATAGGQVEANVRARIPVAQSGVVSEVLVRAGDRVAEGDVLVRLSDRDLALGVERAQQALTLSEAALQALQEGSRAEDIAAAEAALRSAQTKLENLKAGPTAEQIAEAEANVRQQQAAVNSANASYNTARDSVSAASIAGAEAELVAAQIAYDNAKEASDDFAFSFTWEAFVEAQKNLAIAQARVDELKAGPKEGSLNSAAAGISSAAANLQRARLELENLLAGATAVQIKAAESAVAQAQANLDDLQSGAGDSDLIKAAAEVEQARLNVAAAEEALADAQVRAPFAGVVTEVLVSVGERASGEAVELVSDDLKVVLNVDEVDIGRLRPGQEATITLETWPDRALPGQVTSIAPSAAASGDGIVSYAVTISFDPEELPVLVGMTADARLITEQKGDVLLVPNGAIRANRAAGTYTVNRVTGEVDGVPQTEAVPVTIGLRDDNYTQINDGLQAGDRVLIGELAAPTLNFGGPPGFGN
jgi:HlyD family secretion protein